jgi:GH25 family lysozyme M1 (1,4-beta-N-acetylmuramidase)
MSILVRVFLEDYGLFFDVAVNKVYENFIKQEVSGKMFFYYANAIQNKEEGKSYVDGEKHGLLRTMRECAMKNANDGSRTFTSRSESLFGKRPEYYFSTSH